MGTCASRPMASNNPVSKQNVFFASLEGLRGLAAIGVVFYHTWWHWHINDVSFVRHGQLFVDLFFVISGFVISHIYLNRLGSPRDLFAFAALRTARLYPLHLFSLLLVTCYTLVTAWLASAWSLRIGPEHNVDIVGNTLPRFFENLFLTHALSVQHGYYFNRPSWSISTEYFTYFVFAVAVFCAQGRRWLLYPALAALAIGPAAYLWSKGGLTVNVNFPRCLAEFCTGIFVQLLWRRTQARLTPLVNIGWLAHFLEALCVMAIILTLCFWADGLGEFLVIPLFAVSVFIFCLSRGFIVRLLETRYIQYLGKWSYSIYMMHFMVIVMFTDLFKLIYGRRTIYFIGMPWTRSFGWTLVLLVVVLVIARQTYTFIEAPPRAWAKQWLRREKKSLGTT